jgi:hypothetical protein
MGAYVIWFLSTCACAAGIVAVRSIRLKRRAGPADLSWRGVIGLSILFGALPAIAYALMPGPEVEVPQTVLDRIMVPGESR